MPLLCGKIRATTTLASFKERMRDVELSEELAIAILRKSCKHKNYAITDHILLSMKISKEGLHKIFIIACESGNKEIILRMLVEPDIINMLHHDNNLALRLLLSNSPEIAVMLLKYRNVIDSIADGSNIVLATALQCGLTHFAEYLCKIKTVQEQLGSLEGNVLLQAAKAGLETLVDNILGLCTISSAEDNVKLSEAAKEARNQGYASIARKLQNRYTRFLFGGFREPSEDESGFKPLGFSTINLKDVHPVGTTLLQFTKRLEEDFKKDEEVSLSTRKECSTFLRLASG